MSMLQRAHVYILCLKGFMSFLWVGILGEISGVGLNRIVISFPSVSLNMFCQNKLIREFKLLYKSVSLLYFYHRSVWL